MSKTSKNDETIAVENFSPKLNDEYQSLFDKLLYKLSVNVASKRNSIIEKEIKNINNDVINMENDIDALYYVASLNVLLDLSKQGWIFDFDDNGSLLLKMDNENNNDKGKIRYRLSAERNAQFQEPSIINFIKKMEAEREYNGKQVSIKNLIGSKELLIKSIKNSKKICRPYIQLVTNDKDEHTGLKLSEIWRYFRYTWSIPYKTMPGRNLFYLVRDENQPYHPVMGIFALGNSVLNLTVRDDDIGWTVNSIRKNMNRLYEKNNFSRIIRNTNGEKTNVEVTNYLETEEEYKKRSAEYADIILPLLEKHIKDAISDIYCSDLGYYRQTKYPKQEFIDNLYKIAEESAKKSINNKNNEHDPDYMEEAQTNLFTRKRATELAKLLATKSVFSMASGETNFEKLSDLLSTDIGRKAINNALISNRKCKIGSNMMDIIVCGSIPPYNEILGGKLISILACSPTVIRDYTKKYENQVSEIASRMKGKKVVRDSKLVYLGTTSLYSMGSSQYNRIKVKFGNDYYLQFRKMGITEGYGTVYFSKATTRLLSKILEIKDGGKRISHVFGEGTSPRFRIISRGLSELGVSATSFLQHYSPRIVYSINLAQNTNEYLLGIDSDVNYGFDINSENEVRERTQNLIDYWYTRWLLMRLNSVDVIDRLNTFDENTVLLSNY